MKKRDRPMTRKQKEIQPGITPMVEVADERRPLLAAPVCVDPLAPTQVPLPAGVTT